MTKILPPKRIHPCIINRPLTPFKNQVFSNQIDRWTLTRPRQYVHEDFRSMMIYMFTNTSRYTLDKVRFTGVPKVLRVWHSFSKQDFEKYSEELMKIYFSTDDTGTGQAEPSLFREGSKSDLWIDATYNTVFSFDKQYMNSLEVAIWRQFRDMGLFDLVRA